jgi:hypothetical protein
VQDAIRVGLARTKDQSVLPGMTWTRGRIQFVGVPRPTYSLKRA